MLKKINKTPIELPTSSQESIIPDPWETVRPEPHVPSPLELDRLLTDAHPLIGAAAAYPAISCGEQPTALLSSPHPVGLAMRAAGILLQNELKLPPNLGAQMSAQIGEALALLYWMTTRPEPAVL